MLAVFAITLVSKEFSAFVALVISAVILAVLADTLVFKVAILFVFAVMLDVFAFTDVGNPAIVAAAIPPTLFTVVAKLPLPDPVTSPVKVVLAVAAITSVPITKPKLVLAPAAVVAPVPPFAMAMVVPFHTPVVIVPTVFKFGRAVNVLLDVAVMLPAVVAVVALPDKFPVRLPVTFPVTFPVTLPVRFPVNPEAVTDVNPASVVDVAPNAILVVPIVTELFANLLLGIFPNNLSSVIFPPNLALEILPSATPALALC